MARRVVAPLAVSLLVVIPLGYFATRAFMDASRRASARALTNARPSPEALAREVLDRLAGNDTDGIVALRITAEEFCGAVWPELPAAEDDRIPCDWVFGQATIKSNAGLREVVGRYAARRLHFVGLRFDKPAEEYDTFRVLRDPRLTVVDETGTQLELRLFGSVLEMDGRYKLFSFVVE